MFNWILRNVLGKIAAFVVRRRFNAFAKMQTELSEAKTALAERKTTDRAKAILMASRNLSEPDAYALLRSAAMNQGRRTADVAEAVITASSILGAGA